MVTVYLRYYQRDATDAVFSYWQRGGPGSPLISLATGSGKSLVAGEIVRRIAQEYGARVVVATHRKELIAQDAKAIRQLWPDAPVGIYSAGLGSRRIDQISVVGIQSVWRKPELFGSVAVVVIDESHLVSPDDGTMYAKWLAGLRVANPDLRLVGLTATPFRMGQGLLTEGDGRLFDCVVYQSDIMRLVQEGFLSPLVPAKASAQVDTANVGTSNGDFIARDLELAADLDSVNRAVARDVADQMAGGRKGALVFCCGVSHAGHMRAALQMEGVRAEVVVGETPNRDAIISAYKARELPCIVSCDVLTTGFDAPHTDVLAVVRPTQSPGLWIQLAGRGMRIADGKKDCVVLDYGGNIARHGPITEVRPKAKKKDGKKSTAPTKICEHCLAQNPASAATCLHCDAEFPLPEKRANAEASELDPMAAPKPSTHVVGHVSARVHTSREKGTRTLAVSFLDPSWQPIVTQYVCLEHDGYARSKAEQFWAAFFRGPCPTSCDDGAEAFKAGYMRHVEEVTVKPDGKYKKLVSAKIVDRQPGEDDDDDPVIVESGELTDADVANAAAEEKPKKMFDGGGLFLFVTPKGGKLWRMKYRFDGVERLLSLGSYPDVSLDMARDRRAVARREIAIGRDPSNKLSRAARAKIVDREPGDDVDDEIPPAPAPLDGMDDIPF